MRGERPWPTTCDRCDAHLSVSSMSFFNDDICCVACLEDEKLAPTYPEAKADEERAVRAGNFNYSAGLTPADRAFLRECREARRGASDGIA